VDFTLGPDQELLRDTARGLLARECPPALVRAHVDEPEVYRPLWRHLREYVPLGAGRLTDLVLFLDETGYACAPGPFLATTLYAALTGDTTTTGTVALAGAAGAWSPNREPVKTFVLEADRVERIAIVTGDASACRLTLVEPEPVRLRHVPTVDPSRRVFEIDTTGLAFDGAELDAATFADWSARVYVSIAAEMIGTARHIFTMTLDYAKHRRQFDRPIGSFQAIQHKLAEMSLELERAIAAVQYGAMAVDAITPERHHAAHVAKAAAGQAARRILKDGIQIHGGIGYTWEHDLHLYLRRATADECLLGTTGAHHDAIADLVLGGVSASS
jgi:alkylation response protein AidB-like acyl-CoA dehydrogenase